MTRKKQVVLNTESGKERIEEINEPVEKIEQQPSQPTENNGIDLEAEFSNMEKTSSEFDPENTEEQIPTDDKKDDKLNDFEIARIRIFIGFACYFMSGFHTILFNKLRHFAVPSKEMQFGDDEKEALMVYLQNRQVLELIDKVPTWVIGLVHMEYIMITKYNAVCDNYKLPDPTPEKK